MVAPDKVNISHGVPATAPLSANTITASVFRLRTINPRCNALLIRLLLFSCSMLIVLEVAVWRYWKFEYDISLV